MRKSVQTVFGIVESCGITQHVGGTNMSKNPRMFSKFRRCGKPKFLLYSQVLAGNKTFKKGERSEQFFRLQAKYLSSAAAGFLSGTV